MKLTQTSNKHYECDVCGEQWHRMDGTLFAALRLIQQLKEQGAYPSYDGGLEKGLQRARNRLNAANS